MARRVFVYALVYGSIGAAIGVMLALYTKDVEIPAQIVARSNGSNHKGSTGEVVEATKDTPVQPVQEEN
jgi:hypothetical protein